MYTVCKTIIPERFSANVFTIIDTPCPTVTESSVTLYVGGCQQLVLLVSFHPSLQVYGSLASDRHQLKSDIKSEKKTFVRFQLPRLMVHARHFTQAGRQFQLVGWPLTD